MAKAETRCSLVDVSLTDILEKSSGLSPTHSNQNSTSPIPSEGCSSSLAGTPLEYDSKIRRPPEDALEVRDSGTELYNRTKSTGSHHRLKQYFEGAALVLSYGERENRTLLRLPAWIASMRIDASVTVSTHRPDSLQVLLNKGQQETYDFHNPAVESFPILLERQRNTLPITSSRLLDGCDRNTPSGQQMKEALRPKFRKTADQKWRQRIAYQASLGDKSGFFIQMPPQMPISSLSPFIERSEFAKDCQALGVPRDMPRPSQANLPIRKPASPVLLLTGPETTIEQPHISKAWSLWRGIIVKFGDFDIGFLCGLLLGLSIPLVYITYGPNLG